MRKIHLKWGLIGVIILQIASIIFLTRIYKQFTANPDNYYKNVLARQINQE